MTILNIHNELSLKMRKLILSMEEAEQQEVAEI